MTDVLIIGSGLGGLVCGSILSRHGFNVTIVEQCHQIGGCLQMVKRFGTSFDTGIHYVGGMAEGQILYRLFDYLDLNKDVRLSRLDDNGYDIFNIGGNYCRYASGYDNFVDTLCRSFPSRRADIERYIKGIRDIAAASPLYNMRKIDIDNVFIEPDYVKKSVNEFIASCTDDAGLANALAGNLPLYAGVKDKTPIYIHALINNLYIQSAWRIVGGGESIASSLAASIRRAGGSIITGKKAVKLECDETSAKRVLFEDGSVIEAKAFISNVHPQTMMPMLEDVGLLRKAFRDRINSLENTTSCFTIYIKFKPQSLPYMNSNYYYYRKPDVWAAMDYDPDNYPESFLYMHQCSEENQKFAVGAQLISYMHWDDVKMWENSTIGRRGADYKEFKQRIAEKCLRRLEECLPGTISAIEAYETSTPLTYRDYTGTRLGSMYGILRDKNYPAQTLVSQRTKIPNLYMTGQNINSHGVLGVTIGAALTCAEFLGLSTIVEEIDK